MKRTGKLDFPIPLMETGEGTFSSPWWQKG